MTEELPENVHREIARLSAAGDALAKQKKYDEAVIEYRRAWDLLPAPKENWGAASWLLAAIGEAYFFSRRFDDARATFAQAILRAGGLGNPFLHLRHGEALFECGKKREAADELMRAYMGAGRKIFQEEDPKYLHYLTTVAAL
jgi:tetratricopeptide (TPR) repeat protein